MTLPEYLRLAKVPGGSADVIAAAALTSAVQFWNRDDRDLPQSLAEWPSGQLADLMVIRQVPGDHPAARSQHWIGEGLRPGKASPGPEASTAVPEGWQGAVWRIAAPLLAYARQQAEAALGSNASFLARRACAAWMSTPPGSLLQPLVGAFVLDMNAARAVAGMNAAATGNWFDLHLASICDHPSGRAEFLDRYTLLGRILGAKLQGWRDAGVEFAARLAADEHAIAAMLGAGSLTFRQVTAGAGDPHQGCRTVACVEFAEGRVAYRPRPVRSANALRNFAAILRARHGVPAEVFLPEVIDREIYGWMTWIESRPCADPAGMARYYYRLGQLNAVAWLIGANDLHSENIVASGDAPFLVDVDTLITPVMPAAPRRYDEPAADLILRSPLATGILPFDVDLGGGHRAEMSAYADVHDDPGVEITTWENGGTSDMRAVRRQLPPTAKRNIPRTPAGEPADPFQYSDDFIRGSSEIFRSVAGASQEILSDDALAKCWRDLRVRVVLKNTARYWAVSEALYHPANLHNPFLAEDALQSLLEKSDHLAPDDRRAIFETERAAILRGDVPYFEVTADERALRGCDGSLLPDFFVASPVANLRERVRRAATTRPTLEWVTRASLRTADINRQGRHALRVCCHEPGPGPVSRQALVAAASAIGRRITRLAQPDGDGIGWFTLRVQDDGKWRVFPADNSLYLGTLGILVFLEVLCRVGAADPEVADLRQALRATWAARDPTASYRGPGVLDGLAGDLYASRLLVQDVGSAGLTPRIMATLEHLDGTVSGTDLLSGAAGIVLALSRLAGRRPADDPLRRISLRRAEPYVRHILDAAVDRQTGRSWDSPDGEALIGFAHGSVGITRALAEYSSLPGTPFAAECLVAMQAADEWERSKYDETAGNWPDLRQPEANGEAEWSYSWCNGAAGIAMARAMRLLGCPDNQEASWLRADLEQALQVSVSHGLGLGQPLCHGDLGIADALQIGADVVGRNSWARKARQIAGMVATDVLEHDGSCTQEFGPGVDLPGLINGAAGVGYQLLRCAFPGQVPSVLALD